jgi:hypothetical protein
MKFTIALLLFSIPFRFLAQNSFISWENLDNPVYENENWSVKDACMIYKEQTGEFYLFFSAFIHVGDRVNSHVVSVKTKNWKEFSEPLFIWDGHDMGWYGLCSPEIHYFQGKYILSYNGWGDKKGKVNQLYYAISEDLENWDKDHPLGRDVTRGFRAIDAAMAFHNNRYYLFYKESKPIGRLPRVDLTRVAWSEKLEGPWEFAYSGYVQFVPEDTSYTERIHENFRLLQIDGKWHMQNTGYWPHEPYIFEIAGNPDEKGWWTVWRNGSKVEIPVQKDFNTAHRANAAHLKDWRKYDGYFYLLFAGNTENKSFWSRGHNRLGLARSKDLIHWEVPPGR